MHKGCMGLTGMWYVHGTSSSLFEAGMWCMHGTYGDHVIYLVQNYMYYKKHVVGIKRWDNFTQKMQLFFYLFL